MTVPYRKYLPPAVWPSDPSCPCLFYTSPLGLVTVKDIINVHDSGILINPQTARAQVHGGMSMGLGYGLSEELLVDEKTGRPLNNNLLDYKIPTAMDTPDLNVEFIQLEDTTSRCV